MTDIVNLPPCPSCGGRVPDDTIWLRQQKFYCSEECAKPKRPAGSLMIPPTLIR